jgi:hypothetical protein
VAAAFDPAGRLQPVEDAGQGSRIKTGPIAHSPSGRRIFLSQKIDDHGLNRREIEFRQTTRPVACSGLLCPGQHEKNAIFHPQGHVTAFLFAYDYFVYK